MGSPTRLRTMLVFGTRPEAIKMAPLVRQFLKQGERFQTRVCVTAQHRDMLDQVLAFFDIRPDFDLDLMKADQGLTDITSNVLIGMGRVFQEWRPDLVLVHGDTTTTFATTLAAFYHKVPVGHIEAGLRTGNIYSPWPEEANRKLVTTLAAVNFAPTDTARDNLIAEGVSAKTIHVTGNTVIDALFLARERIEQDHTLRRSFEAQFSYLDQNDRLLLVTGHRRENFGEGIRSICAAIAEVASQFPDLKVIYPVHPNPSVREPVAASLSNVSNVFLLDPLEYLPFVYLLSRSTIILTDSGGVQEEAPSFGKPVLVMRDHTERPEAVKVGTVKMVGTSKQKIVNGIAELLSDPAAYSKMAAAHNPYGDGLASPRILDVIAGRAAW